MKYRNEIYKGIDNLIFIVYTYEFNKENRFNISLYNHKIKKRNISTQVSEYMLKSCILLTDIFVE